MKIRHSTSSGEGEKVELQMTPMIDIVFQLLVFFIMTFKVVSQEGDFNIRMPLAAPQQGNPDDLDTIPPMKVRLRAASNGALSSIALNDAPVQGFDELRNKVIAVIGVDRGPAQEDAEVELDCDYNLHYNHVIEAITAVSGYVQDDEVIHLVEKIKFAPQRPAAP